MFLETLEELFPNGTSIDGWPSSPPSRAPSPLPDVIEEEVASPTDFTHDSEEDPATPPLLGLGLPTGDDEETDDFHGISAITPRWRPFSLAPEPTSFVLRGDVGLSKREVIDGPAGPFTEKHSLQLESIKDDLVQRDIVIIEHLSVLHPEHKLLWEMQGEDESYQSSPESVIEFDTESDSDSDSDFMPSKPTITKRDEQTSDKENASTKKAIGAGHKSNAVQSAPAPSTVASEPPIERLIPESPTLTELYDIVSISQVWLIVPSKEGEVLPAGIKYRARAVRPSRGGPNGLGIKTEDEVRALYFPTCCGRTEARSSEKRHATTVVEHYPRLREHLLSMVGYTFYRCSGGVVKVQPRKGDRVADDKPKFKECTNAQTRWDTFKRAHATSKCSNHDPEAKMGDQRFLATIENPDTYAKVHEHLTSKRETLIKKTLAAINGVPLTEQFVATQVMDEWDVIPDPICKKLDQSGLYHCFTEADIKARDDAVACAQA